MPDHEIEGADSIIINDHKAFADGPPGTVDKAADYNSVWRGLMRLLLDSGVGLAPSAVAAFGENWDRILRSVRRLSRKLKQNDFQMASSGDTLNPNPDEFCFLIKDTTNGPFVNGTVILGSAAYPDTNDRLVTLVNASDSVKWILAVGGTNSLALRCRLLPGQVVTFFGVPDDGLTAWVPQDGQNSDAYFELDCRLETAAASPVDVSSLKPGNGFTLRYILHARSNLITWIIPALGSPTFTIPASCADLRIRKSDGSALPVSILPMDKRITSGADSGGDNTKIVHPIFLNISGELEWGILTISAQGGTPFANIARVSGANFTSGGGAAISGTRVTFERNDALAF